MKKRNSKKQANNLKTANKHITSLFKEADNICLSEQSLANRYSTLARKLAMKFRIKLTPAFKNKFCKHCYSYLTPKNSRTRIHKSRIITFCSKCKKHRRIPLTPKF